MSIVYLDVDDEITSAAARIRTAPEVDVALVLPAGSRIATSRINFRLLAREASSRSRRLAIVAPEASTRALAASAGLPVFASVMEYGEARGAADGEAAGAPIPIAAPAPTAGPGRRSRSRLPLRRQGPGRRSGRAAPRRRSKRERRVRGARTPPRPR
ncbi:MAG: hypothetical protein V2B17_04080, partial [Chloroflexota bacterium]